MVRPVSGSSALPNLCSNPRQRPGFGAQARFPATRRKRERRLIMDPDETDDLAHRRDRLYSELAKRTVSRPQSSRKTSGWGEATKIASEFVAGIVVGVVLGLIIDRAFGTSPFGLIVCLMLGFAAGVLNVLRTQGVLPDAGAGLRGDAAKAQRTPEADAGADKNETTD